MASALLKGRERGQEWLQCYGPDRRGYHATTSYPRATHDHHQRHFVLRPDSRHAATVASDGHGERLHGRRRGDCLAGGGGESGVCGLQLSALSLSARDGTACGVVGELTVVS